MGRGRREGKVIKLKRQLESTYHVFAGGPVELCLTNYISSSLFKQSYYLVKPAFISLIY